MKVTIRRSDYEKILEHSFACFPEEACGLLAGTDEGAERTIAKVYLLTNMDHSREHFSLDPREQLEAVKDMRARGLKPLGNWHSHPETPSRPSAEDIRLAFDSRASYLILSLMDSQRPALHSFHIEKGQAEKEELLILE